MTGQPGPQTLAPALAPAEAAAGCADQPLPVRVEHEATVWRGFRRLDRIVAESRPSPLRPPVRLDYEVLRVGRIAAVLPYDPERDALLLIRQFRLGAHLAHGKGLDVEIIAGRVDAGETVEAAARREAREEGGLTLDALEPMFDYCPIPAAADEFARFFLARAALHTVPAVTGLVEEHEAILPFVVPAAAAIEAVRAGLVTNGYAMTALFWFALERTAIRRRWGFPD